MEKSALRQFDTPSILTGLTGLYTTRKIGGVNAVLAYVSGNKDARVDTTTKGALFPEDIKLELFMQHEALQEVCTTLPEPGQVKGWFKDARARLGKHLMLRPRNG